MRTILIAAVALWATVAAHSDVRAAPEDDPASAGTTDGEVADAWQRQTLQLSVGLGSPVGLVGLVYGSPAWRLFWVQAGFGVGFSGLLLSAMPRVAVYSGPACRIGFGAGLGIGYGSFIAKIRTVGPWTAWLDVDALAVDCRGRKGSVFSFGIGVTSRLTEAPPHDESGLPYLGDGGPQIHFGFGRAF